MSQHDLIAPPARVTGSAVESRIVRGAVGTSSRDDVFGFLLGHAAGDATSPRLSRPANDAETSLRRIRVPAVSSRPWCLVCALDIEFPAGSREGSGWLAGRDTVITAGHNVFSAALGGWARSVIVSPGQDEQAVPNGRFTASSFLSVRGWVEQADPRFDYAMIRLPNPVGDRLGYFSYAAYSDEELARRNLNIAGYPLYPGLGEQLIYHGNKVREVSPYHLFYEIRTQPGESGSPVWVHDHAGSEPVVVAIHTSGPGRVDPSLGVVAPAGTRITHEVLRTIESWVAGV